jgi:gliding motility-associated-like protein
LALPPVTLTSSDADNIFCQGTTVSFIAGGGVLYNFKVGGVTVQNGASNTYTTSSLINGQKVSVTVTSSDGCVATSPEITNLVNSLPFIIVTSAPACASDLLTYSLEVTVSSGTVTTTPAQSVVNIGGNIWRINNVPSGTNIIVRVSDLNSCESTLPVTAPNCSCPVIQAPVSGGDKSYCEGGTIPTLNVTVSAGETADWYSAPSGGTLLLGGSLSYTPPVAGTYYAIARNISTSCVSSTRTAVSVIMNPLPIPSLISSDSDNIFCAGTSITFTAEGGVGFNFRVNGSSVQNGPSNKYISSSLTNNQVVDVIVTNSNSCSATSAGITNTVNALPVPTLGSSDIDNSFCAGTSVTFTAGGGNSYNFRVAGASVQSGASNTYTTTSLTNNQVVDVIVSNSNGCTATSAGITNTVYALPSPALTSSDVDNIICSGTSVIFTAGGGTNYNFRVGGTSVQNGTSTTYTTSSLTNNQVVDVIVTNANGCIATSSSITMAVNALPTPSLTSSDADNSFCAGTSVTFTAGGGTSYNFRVAGVSVQSGSSNTYTTTSLTNNQVVSVIVTNSNGCSATSAGITNTVYALPVPTLVSSDANNSFCAGTSVTFTAGGGTSYNFRVAGASVQSGASNTYTTTSLTNNQVVDVIVTNSNGCTATSAGITNTVYALPVPTLTSSDADNTICAGISVTFTAGGGTGYNFRVGGVSVQNGASNTYTTTSLTNNQVVDVIVTNSNGCIATSSGIATTVYQVPVANGGPGGSECDLNFTFGAIPSIGTGVWTQTSGTGTSVFTPSANSATATVTVTLSGTYTFTWTETSNGCSSSSVVTVNFFQQPSADAGTGGTNCGPVFTLGAIPGVGTGTWSLSSGPGSAVFAPNVNTATASVTVSAYGTYTFTWTEVNGTCSDSETINVSFLQVPVPNAGADASVCDLKHRFNAVPGTGAGAGSWSVISGPGAALFTPDAAQPDASVSVDEYGTYDFAWTEVNGSCLATDVVRVIFRSLPLVSAGRDTMICRDGSIRLTATGTGTFRWTPSVLVINPNIASPVVLPIDSEYFVVTLTDQYGCVNKDSVFVDVWDQPLAFAGPDTTLNYIFSLKMNGDALKLHETGLWTLVSGSASFTDSSSPVTNVNGLSPGENILLWTVTNGMCPPSSDYLAITVNDLVVPTLITPNGDPYNEYFVLRGLETLGRTQLVIFDRAGTQVYKNDNYTNNWNGLDYNGNPLPDDTYFFTIRSQNGTSLSGYLVVRR